MHNDLPSPVMVKDVSNHNQIEFDSFRLVKDGQDRFPINEEEHNMILEAFPSAISVGIFLPTIVVRFKSLPEKPWPLTVAGLPVVFTTDQDTIGFDYGRLGGRVFRALENYDARQNITEELFDAAIQYFEKTLCVQISSILNLAGPWVITVPDDTSFSDLPYFLARTPCHFKKDSDIAQVKEAAFRNTEPAGTIWDEAFYKTLQPGIMLSSGGIFNELLTTSGIVVEDEFGYKYLTLVSHGFPLGKEMVYHPNRNGVFLGRVHDRLTDTDIALLRLSTSQVYQNETFGAKLSDGTTVNPQIIRGIKNLFMMKRYDKVTMNNPFSGHCVGVHLGIEKGRVPSDENVLEHEWVTNEWSYFGNTGNEPMEGSCGSPILDEEGNVVSFFRFLNTKGWAVGIAASTLEIRGYKAV